MTKISDTRIPVRSACCKAGFKVKVEGDESYNICLACEHECSLEEVDQTLDMLRLVLKTIKAYNVGLESVVKEGREIVQTIESIIEKQGDETPESVDAIIGVGDEQQTNQ